MLGPDWGNHVEAPCKDCFDWLESGVYMNEDKTQFDDIPVVDSVDPSGDDLLDSLLSGTRYAPDGDAGEGTTLTYSYAGPGSSFSTTDGGYPLDDDEPDVGLEELTDAEKALYEYALSEIDRFSNLSFTEVEETATDAGILRIAWTGVDDEGSVAWAYLPGAYEAAGDVWLLRESGHTIDDPDFAQTITHEFGHALGLKHPHEAEGEFPVMDTDYDGADYTVMSYNVSARYPEATWADLFPNGYMYYDIIALQYMYGVDTVTTAGADTYTFDTDDRYYMTIWDYAGSDSITINGDEAVNLNLTPGTWSDVGTDIEYWDGSNFWTDSDTVYIAPDVTIERAFGADGNDTITGNTASNLLVGNAGDDLLSGGDGGDTLRGDAGDDTVNGGAGNDRIWAGSGDEGNDRMNGGDGDDIVGGAAGDDYLIGGDGADILFGGSGNDTLVGGSSIESGEDTAGNQLWSGSGDDSVYGASGNDNLGGGAGHDLVVGAAGNDLIYAGSDGNDTIDGGEGDDVAFGSAGNDILNGGDGIDELFGGTDDDQVNGGAGADTLYGGGGNDTLTGGTGDDTLRPGAGDDVLVFADGSGDDVVSGFSVDDDTLDLSATATNFTDLASVQAAASDTDTGLLIDLGGDDSVLLLGLAVSDLNSMSFEF